MRAYMASSNDHWPFVDKLKSVSVHSPAWPTLPEVLGAYMNGGTGAFHCPADVRKLSDDNPLAARFGTRTTWFETEGTSYEWMFSEVYGGKKAGQEMLSRSGGMGVGRADQPLACDFEPFHTGDEHGTFNTLYADLKARTSRGERGRR
jgi:hypothetical protein